MGEGGLLLCYIVGRGRLCVRGINWGSGRWDVGQRCQ